MQATITEPTIWMTFRYRDPSARLECFYCCMTLNNGDRITSYHGQPQCASCYAWAHAPATPAALPVPPAAELVDISRDTTIALIRQYLKLRSGKEWSVKGNRGTAWGWIKITAPPKRRVSRYHGCSGELTAEDAAELGKLLGMSRPVHFQGETIAASFEYYREYIDRAAGRAPTQCGTPYWD